MSDWDGTQCDGFSSKHSDKPQLMAYNKDKLQMKVGVGNLKSNGDRFVISQFEEMFPW